MFFLSGYFSSHPVTLRAMPPDWRTVQDTIVALIPEAAQVNLHARCITPICVTLVHSPTRMTAKIIIVGHWD